MATLNFDELYSLNTEIFKDQEERKVELLCKKCKKPLSVFYSKTFILDEKEITCEKCHEIELLKR